MLRAGGTVLKSVADQHVETEYKKLDLQRRALRADRTAQELAALKATNRDLSKLRRGRPSKSTG